MVCKNQILSLDIVSVVSPTLFYGKSIVIGSTSEEKDIDSFGKTAVF